MGNRTSSHWPITVTNGFAAMLNVFLPIGLVRILTPDQVGRYKIFFLYVLLAPGLFMTGGFSNGLYQWMGNYPKTKPELRQSWTLCFGLILIFSILGLLFAVPLTRLVKVADVDFRAFMLAAPFAVAAGFFEDLMIARGDIWAGSWYSSGFSLVRTSAILAAAWWTRQVEMVFVAYIGVTILRVIVGWKFLSKSGELTPLFSMEKSKAVLRYAVPVSLAAFAGVGLGNIDQMILSFRLSPAQFAFYSMGCLTMPMLDVLETSVNRVLIPRMARAFVADDKPKVAALFADAVSELWRFLLPATVGLALFSKPIVIMLFTERYAAAAQYLRLYAFSYLLTAFSSNSVARARADGAWILKTTFISAPIGLLITFLFTARWNAMGALVSVLVTTMGIRVYAMMYNRKRLGLPYSSFIPFRDILTQVGVVLLAAAVSLALRPLFHHARAWFLVTGPIFTAIYFGATYALFLKRFMAALEFRPHILQLAVRHGHNREFEKILDSLSQSLMQRDRFRVTVASYGDPGGKLPSLATFGESGIPLTLWRKKEGFSPPMAFRIMRLVFTDNVNIIHAHDFGPLIYGSLVKLMTLEHVRLILTVHNVLDTQHPPLLQFFYKIFLRFPDRIIAVSNEARLGLQKLGIDSILVTEASETTAASYLEIFSGENKHE